jgi:2,4-dienoyl-CoA reductase (NADPH2)
VAVVGAGPAGLACAVTAAECGHRVTLYEATDRIGGQFKLARRIPGKEEFAQTLRYFDRRLQALGVEVHLGRRVRADELAAGHDDWVVATGVRPRDLGWDAQPAGRVMSYVEAIEHPQRVGRRVGIVGAGGIGFDVAELLSHPRSMQPAEGGQGPGEIEADGWAEFAAEWGIDLSSHARGGLLPPAGPASPREVWLLPWDCVWARPPGGSVVPCWPGAACTCGRVSGMGMWMTPACIWSCRANPGAWRWTPWCCARGRSRWMNSQGCCVRRGSPCA